MGTRLTVHRALDIFSDSVQNDQEWLLEDSGWKIFLGGASFDYSASLSRGNLVDGSPRARLLKLLGDPMGGTPSATIYTLDHVFRIFECQKDSTCPERSGQVFFCILRLRMQGSIRKIDNEVEVSSGRQAFAYRVKKLKIF